MFKAPARKAVGTKPRAGEFDYLAHILQMRAGSQVLVELVEQTDHSFANRAGRNAVAELTERWLRTYTPSGKQEEFDIKIPATQKSNSENGKYYELDCLRS